MGNFPDMNRCAQCGERTLPGNTLCPYHLGEYWRTQGHTAIRPICPSPVADNDDRLSLEQARRQLFDALAATEITEIPPTDTAGKVR